MTVGPAEPNKDPTNEDGGEKSVILRREGAIITGVPFYEDSEDPGDPFSLQTVGMQIEGSLLGDGSTDVRVIQSRGGE